MLENTYWVRFSYKGRGHAAFSHDVAVENTKRLFDAARAAGVKRIVHTGNTQPDAQSELPYFHGRAELEDALSATGFPHSILRPAVLFGETPEESILINNMAWSLHHLPAVATFGLLAARVLGSLVGDVVLTRDEIAGLCQDHLAVDCPPAGRRSLREWAARHAGSLGKTYASELSRRASLASK